MVEPQTLSQVLTRLTNQGYTDNLKAEADGSMRVFPHDMTIEPEDLVVDDIFRFEGETNLDDEEVLFVVSNSKLGVKGTYVTAFGPKMDPIDADIVLRLQKKYQRARHSA